MLLLQTAKTALVAAFAVISAFVTAHKVDPVSLTYLIDGVAATTGLSSMAPVLYHAQALLDIPLPKLDLLELATIGLSNAHLRLDACPFYNSVKDFVPTLYHVQAFFDIPPPKPDFLELVTSLSNAHLWLDTCPLYNSVEDLCKSLRCRR